MKSCLFILMTGYFWFIICEMVAENVSKVSNTFWHQVIIELVVVAVMNVWLAILMNAVLSDE